VTTQAQEGVPPTGTPTLSLVLPSDWYELDPRSEDLVAALREALADVDLGGLDEDTAVTLLAPAALELRRITQLTDMVLFGGYATAVPVDGAEWPYVVSASVTVMLSPPTGGDGLGEVREALERQTQRDERADVRVVTLPAGPAVVASGRTLLSDESWDEPVEACTRRYFIPVPGSDRLAVLAFLTPNVVLVEHFGQVFDAIAESVAFSSAG
jgi:hypothetical protein